MIILAEDKKSGAVIFIWNKNVNNPIFKIELGGYEYSHSVQGIEDPSSYEWYCDVMGRQMLDLYDRSVKAGKNEVQNAIKQALGVN